MVKSGGYAADVRWFTDIDEENVDGCKGEINVCPKHTYGGKGSYAYMRDML